MPPYLTGLGIGLAYVAPIGMQNLFVINSALTQPRHKALLTALIVVFFDVTLALACFFGIGALMEHFTWLQMVILLVGGAILIWRKVISWRIPVAYIGAVAVLTLVFNKGDDAFLWMLYSVMGGGVMLGAIFMATDYVTSPALPAAQLVYGLGCGVLTVIFRYFGLFPEGVTYAILIMNACAWALDKAVPVKRFGVAKGGAGK